MPRIHFITAKGHRHDINAEDGTLMQAAVAHSVPGIDADCGGACSCATCHVRIDPAWFGKVGPAGDIEAALLEFEDNAGETSRLSCQIDLSSHLDGLIVEVANG